MQLFTKTVIELDKTTKFVKRKSKLGSRLFVEALVSGCLSDTTISLERLCRLMKQKGVKIRKQGLHQRFNSASVSLMQNFFLKATEQFRAENSNVINLLKSFSTVHMVDSSGISLPTNLKNLYRGSGGAASESGIKVQVLFDYMRGQIEQLEITEGCRSDQGYYGHLNKIEKGALYLQDLGYFKVKSFMTIQDQGSYFISRYFNAVKIFNEKGKVIDLLNELQNSGAICEKKVRVGQNEKMEVRLIAQRLSNEDAEKRIRKIKRDAKKNKRQPTKETLALAQWSIYITNVPKQMLSAEQIYLVYSLRWQIELFFKLCKSEAGIAKISGKKVNRILCEIYAKLACIVMLLYLCFPLRWEKCSEISFIKAYKEFASRAIDFYRALKSLYRFTKFIEIFFSDLRDFAFKDRHRKKRRLTCQKLMDTTGQEVLI